MNQQSSEVKDYQMAAFASVLTGVVAGMSVGLIVGWWFLAQALKGRDDET